MAGWRHSSTCTQPEVRPDARRFENWETNDATKIGLGVAVDYALSWGFEAIESRVTTLASNLRSMLHELPGTSPPWSGHPSSWKDVARLMGPTTSSGRG